MARKLETIFACSACGAQSPRWIGRCPECGGWNTVAEEKGRREERQAAAPDAPAPRALADVDADELPRVPTGLADFDRVLGGGLVPGSVVLLGGEPGIGKSTLLLQVAARLAARGRTALYVSAEGSARQGKARPHPP